MERTTAFMPALSPPEVRMAIFIVIVDSRNFLKRVEVCERKEKGFISYT
jgi:hypothetical protein